ncbi:2-nitropropane dioxygenase [Dentipellis sp. KUC8613]|nr:2-nitropropane dioxygenase [Dentipellis sp. KUC8613]
MSTIYTSITRLLSVRTPVVLAPMAGASGGALASQVTLGGGFGFLAPTYDGSEKFRDQLRIARTNLNVPAQGLPIGVGFLGWRLEMPDSPHVELLKIALENQVQAIWLACGNDTARWVEYIRKHDRETGKDRKTLIFIQVGTVDQAIAAVNEFKPDVLVAQGNESGGHGIAAAPPLFTLVSQILAALPSGTAPPLLAAGGIINGSQVAAYLTLGASGAVLGTRFLLTPETLYSDSRKQAILAAKPNSTVRSGMFDVLNNTLGWPSGVDGRGLRISAVEEAHAGANVDEVKQKFAEGAKQGDPGSTVVYAGIGAESINEIKPAKDIVHELHDDIIERLKASSTFLSQA